MPRVTPLEILNDRAKYPDEMVITLASGDEISVKDYRDQLQTRADFTRASQQWTQREQQYTQAIQGLQGQLNEATERLNAALADRGRPTVPTSPTSASSAATLEDLETDPVLGSLVKGIKSMREELAGVLRESKEHATRLKGHEDAWVQRDYSVKLNELGQRFNTRFNKDGKGKAWDQKAFLDYCLPRQIVDLEAGYTAFTHAEELKAVEEEAEQRGIEKGKAAQRIAHLPDGRGARAPQRPKGLPERLQDLKDEDVLNDPEMRQAMTATEVLP